MFFENPKKTSLMQQYIVIYREKAGCNQNFYKELWLKSHKK